MEKVEDIRNRIKKDKKNKVFKILSVVCGLLSLLLGVLIYMKKDQEASFLKNNFGINANFTKVNENVDNVLDSLFTFRTNSSGVKSVNSNVIYLKSDEDDYFYCEGSQIPSLDYGVVYLVKKELDDSYSLLVEYQNSLLVAYYNVFDPLVKTYDQVKKGDYLCSYNQTFKALFKQNGKMIDYSDIH